MHIAIAGNIGSGKTTLTKLLSKQFNWEAHFEDVDNNPYLESFYDDMQRWSFNLQIYFLNSRLRHIIKIKETDKTVIQDRTIYEDAYIFASNLHEMNLMSTRDYENYISIFELMTSFVSPPDLLIYLRATVPTLVENIQKRGRKYEESIRLDYLSSLNQKYEKWIEDYKIGRLLIIDVDNIDFENNPKDLATFGAPHTICNGLSSPIFTSVICK
jgi:deoxyadenosine/deoxycytidine kinase